MLEGVLDAVETCRDVACDVTVCSQRCRELVQQESRGEGIGGIPLDDVQSTLDVFGERTKTCGDVRSRRSHRGSRIADSGRDRLTAHGFK